MAKHFKSTGQNLFCQDFVIENALNHTNQFLKNLDKEIDFEKLWHEKLLAAYKGEAELGQPPYRPTLILKMLFLSYLFKQTEREIERVINDSISMKAFLGLALDEPAPDHSSLTKFKNRILSYQAFHGKDIFKEIFDEIIILAQEKGVDLGYSQSIDSTHTVADVNTRKEKERTKPIKDGGEGKKPRDPDARWGVKRVKEITTANGKKVKVNESYFGYKDHFSVSTEANIITSYRVTSMNFPDTKAFKWLLKDDIQKGITEKLKMLYTADKAYDDGENHVYLEHEQFKDAIALKGKVEKTKEGKTKAKWTKYTTQEEFEEGKKQRYVVERVNGSVKKDHDLKIARYIGLQKMNIQTAITAMAHNLKTLVKMWTGVGLRTLATTHVS